MKAHKISTALSLQCSYSVCLQVSVWAVSVKWLLAVSCWDDDDFYILVWLFMFLVRWQLVFNFFFSILLSVTTAFCCNGAFTLFRTTVQHKGDVCGGSVRFDLLPVVRLCCFQLTPSTWPRRLRLLTQGCEPAVRSQARRELRGDNRPRCRVSGD